MTQDTLMDLGECTHKPLRPPRDGIHGELVFAVKWEALMAERGNSFDDDGQSNYMLGSILSAIPGPMITQRMATVAASFVTWLGTNCGRGFLIQAQRREAAGTGWGRGYLMEWAMHNLRVLGVSGGVRTLEYILATPDCFGPQSQLSSVPDLSTEDYEVVEHLVVWLATERGQRFLSECEEEIKQLQTAEHVAAAVGRRDWRAVRMYIDGLAK